MCSLDIYFFCIRTLSVALWWKSQIIILFSWYYSSIQNFDWIEVQHSDGNYRICLWYPLVVASNGKNKVFFVLNEKQLFVEIFVYVVHLEMAPNHEKIAKLLLQRSICKIVQNLNIWYQRKQTLFGGNVTKVFRSHNEIGRCICYKT